MALTKVQNTGIADDAVTTDKIENSTVLAADLAASSVTNAKIATGTIGNDKLTNSSITVNGTSVSLGGSTTLKHINWQAVTVADGSTTLTAEAGKGYFLDTNAGVIEVFLPSSPTRGDTIVLADYAGHFALNQAIINTGGQNIDSTVGTDFKLTTNNTIAELVYVDSNKGWLVKLNQAAGSTPSSVLTDGVYDTDAAFISATGGTITTVDTNFKVHSFTGDGTFSVTAGQGSLAIVDYVVVAGGGGGASKDGGGGGAGGYREAKTGNNGTYTASPLANPTGVQITPGNFPITVGGGGGTSPLCQATSGSNASPGSNSVFSTITSAGGGGGGNEDNSAGGNGGSGGGGSGGGNGPAGAGTGNTPPVSPPQGNPGGNTPGGNAPGYGGSGGGGATDPGSGNNGAGNLGHGGDGATNHITGSPVVRAGGGGGGSRGQGGNPGPGGGGVGGSGTSGNQTAGGANTGGGGGGGGESGTEPQQLGRDGGKGVVIIRYKFQ